MRTRRRRGDRQIGLKEARHRLEHLQAGLAARDAWKHGATLWRFEAEVFGESSLNTKDTMDTKERN